MHLERVMHTIQGCLEQSDLVSARQLIEDNMGALQENRHVLKRNVRELVDVLASMMETGIRPLNRQEMNQIHYINNYASTFNVRGLKLSIAENPELLLREDIHHYLNTDAKALLEGMSAI
ncbi:hypothetical protein [Sporosarcina sp. Te-1]|uniref:hypothetical protein n=1 Tax=Sporosarcina sp. Te-1 TaxID=2818390 RepID=UPI001A9FCD1A|nr:hypothetical protein [Sporosarcina sp. Te-1]QTD39940.1 hypothetical protein J3U78_14020 [Sporosarcina sp. Te-1]